MTTTTTRREHSGIRRTSAAVRALAVAVLAAAAVPRANAFAPRSSRIATGTSTTMTTTELGMVFDFFKQRSEEGIEQLSKLTDAAARGDLGQGLADAASYTKATNDAFAAGLALSRERFQSNLEGLFGAASKAETLEDLLEDLQDVLLQADLGVATSDDIVNEVRSLSEARREATTADGELLSRDDLMSIMRGVLIETLDYDRNDDDGGGEDRNSITGASAIRFSPKESKIPTVLFVMGANGMGKTTTIGKLSNRLRVEGDQKVLLAACDTFRAGAVDQLAMWADRAEVDLLGPSSPVSTPTSIAVEACEKALAEGYDTVLVDTAGRLSNNWQLNEELVKMKAAIRDTLGGGDDLPHEALLVLDAAQGRMALDSAKVWNREIGLTGLVLTKLDGTARGGSVVAISKELGLPVKLIGVGEGIDDLRDFEGEKFVDGLLGIGSAGGQSSGADGAQLASRLSALRKERADRAPLVSRASSSAAAAASKAQPNTFNHVAPQGAAPTKKRDNAAKRKKRKKKKGKR